MYKKVYKTFSPLAVTVVQSLSHVWLSGPHELYVACQASLSSTLHPQFAQTHVHWCCVMLSDHFILCCPFIFLPSVFPISESFLISLFFALGGQSIFFSIFIYCVYTWFSLSLAFLGIAVFWICIFPSFTKFRKFLAIISSAKPLFFFLTRMLYL